MKYTWLLAFTLIFASCGGNNEEADAEENTDTTAVEENTIEEMSSEDTTAAEEQPKMEQAVPESIEQAEAKGGMSFCDCVKKVKELDDQIMEEADDAKTETLLAEKEKLVNGDCIVIKAGAQNTPSQRAERERKVRECLNQ